MKWFKFYGQDFLTDTKMISLDPILRIIWVTLLCLSDETGTIKHLREWDLIKLSGCDDDEYSNPSDYDRSKECLKYFEDNGLVKLSKETVTDSNVDVTHPRYTVTLVNYSKRQNEFLSNAERQKRFRQNHKNEAKSNAKDVRNSNVTPRYDSNARTDKNRVDKNIKENYVKEKFSGEDAGVGKSLVREKLKSLGLRG